MLAEVLQLEHKRRADQVADKRLALIADGTDESEEQ